MVDLAQWQQLNPLRKWREQTGVAKTQLAAAIGVSTTTIRAWETGIFAPSAENKSALYQITNSAVSTLDWAQWYDARPNQPQPV